MTEQRGEGWSRPLERRASPVEWGENERAILKVLTTHAEVSRHGGWLNENLLEVGTHAFHPRARARSFRAAVAKLLQAGEIEVAAFDSGWAYRRVESLPDL